VAESGVIADYLTALAAQLPAPIVEEVADGLDQTCKRYLSLGLHPAAAADAALAEFGRSEVIVAAFTRVSPAQRTARRLLAAGPVVGACWGSALIASQAWTWPVPALARLLFGLALMAAIGLLALAAFGTRYRSVRRAGTAGCVSMTALDTALLVSVALAIPAVRWPVFVAAAASAARIVFTARRLRPLLAG
jgi:hypothetical protein